MPPTDRRLDRFARRHGLGDDARAELGALIADERARALASVVPASQLAEVLPAEAEAPPPAETDTPERRYERLEKLGQGGMGEVWRVHDRVLDRRVAMKILRPELGERSGAWDRFAAETRILARLQHPGILPVYEVGRLADGRPFYTMREAEGRPLSALVGTAGARALVDALARVGATLAYAHAQGVVHGDLKPANLMVGSYGEVVVLDWGLAVLRGTGAAAVGGTPGYMAPELLETGPTPRTDVFALGATLRAVLGAAAPDRATWSPLLLADTLGAPSPPAPGRRVPDEALDDLDALVARALAADPRERPTAAGLARALEGWLAGEAERERARALVEEARALLPDIEARRRVAEEQETEAARRLDALPTWAPAEEKAPAWALQDAAARARAEAALVEVRYVETLRAALSRSPELADAHAQLADHYQRRHGDAQARRDAVSAAAFEALVRSHDRGAHALWLAGTGWLSLDTDPPGARARVYRYVDRGRRLVPELVEERELPLRALPLPHGSYLVELLHPERAPVRWPVRVERGAHAPGPPPSSLGAGPRPVWLPPAGALGPDDCYVPEGWFRAGDPEARNGLRLRDVWVDGFVLRRHPVTHAEFLAFLDALLDAGRGEEALLHVPRGSDRRLDPAGVPVYPRGPDGRFFLGPDPEGDTPDPDGPVLLTSWESARAWCAWEAARTGAPWRLPWELEREKAVRGVDGRLYPWGDHPEPSWSCNGQAQSGRPLPRPVGAFPTDESPYGVRGGAGNVRDRCLDVARALGPALTGDGRFVPPDPDDAPPDARRVDRGGAWSAGIAYARAGLRLFTPPGFRNSLIGFRAARSLGPG